MAKAKEKKKEKRFNVYVIRLSEAVLKRRRFCKANPQFIPGKPCVYVGMTARSPKERFEQHRAGYKSARYAKKYGQYLMPRQYSRLNPMTYGKAVEMERELARKLKRRGYAVWQN